MKRLLRYLNRFLLIFAIGLFLLSIVYLVLLVVFGHGNHWVIYWLAYFPPSFETEVVTSFIVTAPIGLGFVVGIKILARRNPNINRITQSIQTAIILALFAQLCLFATPLIRFWQTGPFGNAEHIETVHTTDHVYHLLLYSYVFEGYLDRYLLYECDSLDLLCQETYSVFRRGIHQETNEVSLGTDSKSNRIGLLVNGEVVYTHLFSE